MNHALTTNNCEACHRTTAWSPERRVDHNEVLGNCAYCHNDTIAEGKPDDHPVTNDDCSTCHRTRTWDL